ncbi:MAG: kelch repeat-containing protein, partial [Myxococcales bacterium]|nr:kelch repeat-containing protein [Myxococcales bacterium]
GPGDDDPGPVTPSGPPADNPSAPLTTPPQDHAVVAAAGRVYVLGGFAPGETATVLAYDPAGDSWQPAASLPVAMHHANAAVIDDIIYVAGYLTGLTFSAQGQVYSYDPGQDEWTPLSVMPAGEERGSACVAALDGKLYVIGGSRGGAVAQASTFDPALGQWASLPPLPAAREHCVAGAIDGVLYVASGRAGGISSFESPTYAYDPAVGMWSERASIPIPRGGTAGAVLHGRLYVFGGEGNSADPSGVFPDIQAYDPALDQWEELDDMEVPRHGFGAATLGDTIYLPGGATVQAFGAVTDSSRFGFEAND